MAQSRMAQDRMAHGNDERAAGGAQGLAERAPAAGSTAAGAAGVDGFTDVQTLRRRARESIEGGAVTPGYDADRDTVVRLLNEALATEIVCMLRYKRHYFTAKGVSSQSVAQEFLEHAKEEEEHADRIAERIVQLGAAPDFSPHGLAERSHAEYVAGDTLVEMIREDLVAERIAIDSYREFIRYLGDRDSTTRRLLEDVLATEEEHAEDLLSLIEEIEGK